MNKSNLKFRNIDEYHSMFPAGIQEVLQKLRMTIRQAAPEAEEIISYGMPAFRQIRVLVYYAVNKSHIGFYPTPDPIIRFREELEKYSTSKGAVQFQTNKPLPLAPISKMVKFRVAEEVKRAKAKTFAKSGAAIKADIAAYNKKLPHNYEVLCNLLARSISKNLPKSESKIWHSHPVWFLEGNPIAGYSKQKPGIRLMFWSGADFVEEGLNVRGKKFKDASVFYNKVSEINLKDLKRWLRKSQTIQYDYKNLVKRKGRLLRLK